MLRIELSTHQMHDEHVPVLEVWSNDEQEPVGSSRLLVSMPMDLGTPVYIKGVLDPVDHNVKQLLTDDQAINRRTAQLQQQADEVHPMENSEPLSEDQLTNVELALVAHLLRKYKHLIQVQTYNMGPNWPQSMNISYVRDYSSELHPQLHIVVVRDK